MSYAALRPTGRTGWRFRFGFLRGRASCPTELGTIKMQKLGALVVICASFLGGYSAHAQSFMLSPGTIVFEDRTHSAELLIANMGDRQTLMRIEAANFVMDENGQLKDVAKSAVRSSAEDMLRFSPRQFELRPGDNQTVRIGLRKPANLPNGEYRVHLRVVNVASGKPPAQIAGKNGDMSFVIPINIARAVRVLVRQGVTAGTASVVALSARHRGDNIVVAATFQRSGGGSSSGAYSIVAPSATTVMAKGALTIYADRSTRTVEQKIPRSVLNGENTLCLLYTEDGVKTEKRFCTKIASG